MKTFLRTCTLSIALMSGLGLVTSAYAHHSMNGFDRAKTISITGTVKQFKWANPHSWIEVEVVNSKGVTETWNLEMTAPGILARAGWKSTMLKPGDKATFGVHPMVNGDIGGQFVSVTFADGLTMTERGQQTATPGPAKQ
ncbi:MAG: hypothetical protein LAP61_17040 [Acidobacteriia bacterium]|nr:hypothetical protein [Terriglobia bacterium]